ncbi:hypothetical protein [Paraburkholderia sp. GAS32]|uniref:hypothetical protein n=1 Tax=Paraburkholderia sp. GAS32 TaxID=3035129 RepID=UPI003D1ECE9E
MNLTDEEIFRNGIEVANDLQAQIRDGIEKYTYFLLTAAGACIGYSVEKIARSPIGWQMIPFALSLTGWSISFWLGCRAIKHRVVWLRHNYASCFLSIAHPKPDFRDVNSLIGKAARVADISNKWQFRFFVLGGVAFVTWRLLVLLPHG